MEEHVSGLSKIKSRFGCEKDGADAQFYSPLTLAYIGDAVYDLIVRTVVVERGNRPVNLLHRTAVRYVNAGAQAALIGALADDLTEEETAVYRRGRNAKSHTMAKNASVEDYRKATGMEALLGYLYLSDRFDRILELIGIGLEKTGIEL